MNKTSAARRYRIQIHSSALALGAFFVATLTNPAGAQTTDIVSVSTAGDATDAHSEEIDFAGNGQFVVFATKATTLVPNDTNGASDVILRDVVSHVTERINVSSTGEQANQNSGEPDMSANGRYVAFDSYASNLVSNDSNSDQDIFVRDRQLGTAERVSVATGGGEAHGFSDQAQISDDGRYVAFMSYAGDLVQGDNNGFEDIFVHDRTTNSTIRVSVASDGAPANGLSRGAEFSSNGRVVSFRSLATNLVPNDTNGQSDAFVHDIVTGITERVSVATDGSEANEYSSAGLINTSGRFVAFSSWASNLVAGDTNGFVDCFVRDRDAGTTVRVSVASDGSESNGSQNFCDGISGDGRFVTFNSNANNLVNDDTNGLTDEFIHDRLTGKTERISVANSGDQATGGNSGGGVPNADGRYVAFQSYATNLVPGYSNDHANDRNDIFLRDRGQQMSYSFIGFDNPLQNLPFSNSTKAGSAIPVKWQLKDQSGAFVSDLSAVKSLQYVPVACDSQDIDFENPIDALAPGGSGLQYDATTNQFVYPWKTLKSQAKTCAVFGLTLTDGQQQFARFMLK